MRREHLDAPLVETIKELKSLHPFWGYRRIWAFLQYKNKIIVNHKRVYRLMKKHNLGVMRAALKACRTPQKSKPKATVSCQWWGIDMTKIITKMGWVYVTVVLDWYSKKIVGYHIGYQSKSSHWLSALDMALQANFPYGVRGHNLNLMSDNGCQPTSKSFMETCKQLEINHVLTSYNNPKGNADTERMMRTMKEECLWLEEWENLPDIKNKLSQWIEEYNAEYLHSTLGWKTPNQVHTKNQNTLLKVA